MSLVIAGVDEAGRGPLAGPVVVAAVILDENNPIEGLNDSKKLSAKKRASLFAEIKAKAIAWSIVEVSAQDIDRLNILQATLQGMAQAVARLDPAPTLVRVDGNQKPPITGEVETLIGGDGIDLSIGAASILAKVHRDEWMLKLHHDFPEYGFDRHKGYPTSAHLHALARLGPCPAHRLTFKPVIRALQAHQSVR